MYSFRYFVKKMFVYAVVVISALSLSGCVTILGKRKTITVHSNPSGATVYADGKFVGVTPCSFTRRTTANYLTFCKEGYVTQAMKTKTGFRPAVLWNLLFTGFTGFLVDAPYVVRWKDTFYHATLAKAPNPAEFLSKIPASNSYTKMSSKEVFKKYNRAVFMIYTSGKNGIMQGSGFFVSSSGIGVSNYHVFKGTSQGGEIIKLVNGKTYKIKDVLAYSEENDYIIFRVEGSGFDFIPVTRRGYDIGENVYAIGSPRGLENTFSSGVISQERDGKHIQISVPIDHGSSGGALINEYGEVIGITTGGYNNTGANLNFAIDIRVTNIGNY